MSTSCRVGTRRSGACDMIECRSGCVQGSLDRNKVLCRGAWCVMIVCVCRSGLCACAGVGCRT